MRATLVALATTVVVPAPVAADDGRKGDYPLTRPIDRISGAIRTRPIGGPDGRPGRERDTMNVGDDHPARSANGSSR